MSDGIGTLPLGLLVLGVVASAGRRREPDVAAPALPPPKPTLAGFETVVGTERVIQSQQTIRDGDSVFRAMCYQPPMQPTPWTVRAWYETRRGAHVIDFVPHPSLASSPDLSIEVRVGDEHWADRAQFLAARKPLWPDDKYHNRVVHRASPEQSGLCFLIVVAAQGYRLDFYHEPFAAGGFAPELAAPTPVADWFAGFDRFMELEQAYAAKKDEIAARGDLSPEVKRDVLGLLLQRYEAAQFALIEEETKTRPLRLVERRTG